MVHKIEDRVIGTNDSDHASDTQHKLRIPGSRVEKACYCLTLVLVVDVSHTRRYGGQFIFRGLGMNNRTSNPAMLPARVRRSPDRSRHSVAEFDRWTFTPMTSNGPTVSSVMLLQLMRSVMMPTPPETHQLIAPCDVHGADESRQHRQGANVIARTQSNLPQLRVI